MKYKTDQVKSDWKKMIAGDQSDLLVTVACYVDAISVEITGLQAIVTMICRTQEEQDELIALINPQRIVNGLKPWSLDRKSVHQYLRGIDFRSWIYTEVQRNEIIRRTNKRFAYGRGLKVLRYHANGTAGHLHGQIPHGQTWRM